MKTKKQIHEETHGKQVQPKWYWSTAHSDTEKKREKAIHTYMAKDKLKKIVNAQREILDMPKELIGDIMNRDNHNYYEFTRSSDGKTVKQGMRCIKIKKDLPNGNVNPSAVFSSNFNNSTLGWREDHIEPNLIGFMYQMEDLRSLRNNAKSRQYFSHIDRIINSSGTSAQNFINKTFPSAYDHLEIDCGTYSASVLGDRAKCITDISSVADDVQTDLNLVCLYRTKEGLPKGTKVTTEPFLLKTTEVTSKRKTDHKDRDITKPWTLYVSPLWKKICKPIGVCEMGQRRLFPLKLKEERIGWIADKGRRLYYGTFVDFAFTKRTEDNGYKDRNGNHMGYEFTPRLLQNHYVITEQLPSGKLVTAVSDNIGQANKLLSRKITKGVVNTLGEDQ